MDLIEQWSGVLRLLNLPEAPQVLVASPDDEDVVLAALARERPRAGIIALDIRRQGRGGRSPGSAVQRIQASGPAIAATIAAAAMDLVMLDHALDDIALEAVARHEGIEHEEHRGDYAPKARAIRAYWRSGELETIARPEVIAVVVACERTLRAGGHMVFAHRVIGADLSGQPLDLYTDYLALARSWLGSAGLALRETPLGGFDPHWWMCLERAR